MMVSEIARLLPDVMDWMVLFNLKALMPLFEDITIKKMFFIPEEIALDDFSHAILTPEGTYLALMSDTSIREKYGLEPGQPDLLIRARDGSPAPCVEKNHALLDRFASLAAILPMDEADCLGLGEIPDLLPPALLHIQINGHCGEAKAVFAQEPSQQNYELLRSVGVCYLGGKWQDHLYIAEFSVDLREHIFSGILSNFSRTGYCNAFFLQQGGIGQTLEAGLTDAVEDRIRFALNKVQEKAYELGTQAVSSPMPMACHPPPPMKPYDFGDLVPLGLLTRCLKTSSSMREIQLGEALGSYLKGESRQNLWPFQSNDLPTATDSALVLMGFPDATEDLTGYIQALELFSDGEGGYYPQLWKSSVAAGQTDEIKRALNYSAMAATRWNDHWTQPDFGTTCFVRFHRGSANLPASTPVSYLERGFNQRSSLFFANPYFIDWALALGLEGDTSPEAGLLRERLKGEILAGMLPDYSFGSFDKAISSALAILALISLGYEGRPLFLACMSLAERVIHESAPMVCAPFYSSLKLPDSIAIFYRSSIGEAGSQVVTAGEDVYLISYYLDGYNIIATALITLALQGCLSQGKLSGTFLAPVISQAGNGIHSPDHSRSIEIHQRYRCSTQDEYIAKWALAAFVKTKSGVSD